jgi:hypothetical protein
MFDEPVNADLYSQPVFSQDKRLHVQFYRKAVKNSFKSSQVGRPIYEDVDYVRIFVPGDRNTQLDTPAIPHYQQRFADQWRRYKEGQEEGVDGTPLESWPALSVSQVAELKAVHVRTVEQLAEMSDQLAQKFMGSHALRQKAQAFLEAAKGTAEASKLAAELKKRDDEISAMKEQIALLAKPQPAAPARAAAPAKA